MEVKGSFSNVSGLDKFGFVGRGSIQIVQAGWALRCKQASTWLRILVGVIAAIVAIVLTAVVAMLVEEAGFDFMAYRKGPVLVAMIALALAMGAWTLATMFVDTLLGSERAYNVPRQAIEQIVQDTRYPKLVTLVWNDGGKRVGTTISVSDAQQRAVLVQSAHGP